eukprot:CAMPEP_0172607636 /NCGR_PEP_ID=MMETSP1068-20121228/27792_1 /TAXON_ID=35684 /ORGANISM="Pseudopedinella elastica, Strain CCMP716" /LENGTH=53 /DNA_ID=CAMNT_0013410697 /DNA_START=801 /DNA_END=962 /DNA_ORIENTATION=-
MFDLYAATPIERIRVGGQTQWVKQLAERLKIYAHYILNSQRTTLDQITAGVRS